MTSLAETVIDQFRDAYLEYLPQYLDYLSREYGIDTKGWRDPRETKEGRKLSATTKTTLSGAHKHLIDATDILTALLDEEAGVDDSTPKSAAAMEHKSEPDTHSAAAILTSMRSLLN